MSMSLPPVDAGYAYPSQQVTPEVDETGETIIQVIFTPNVEDPEVEDVSFAGENIDPDDEDAVLMHLIAAIRTIEPDTEGLVELIRMIADREEELNAS